MTIEPFFILAFLVSAAAGVAALVRNPDPITRLKFFSSFLNSGLLGLGVSLVWYTKYREDTYFLLGLCILSGLGGMKSVDFAQKLFWQAVAKLAEQRNNDSK